MCNTDSWWEFAVELRALWDLRGLGWGAVVGERLKREEAYICPWLIHTALQQKRVHTVKQLSPRKNKSSVMRKKKKL